MASLNSVCTVDFETRSELDVRDCGSWKYAEDASTEILCLGWKIDIGPRGLWIPGQPFPQALLDHINSNGIFEAHNAQFERAIWLKILLPKFNIPMPKRWRDTMAVCAYRGLPLALDEVGEVLNLSIQKDKRGKTLIQKLCQPRKPLKAEIKLWEIEHPSEKMPVLWNNDPELLRELYAYCERDVDTEVELSKRVGILPPSEQRVWVLDQVINQRGVQVDLEAVHAAIKVVSTVEQHLEKEIIEITNGFVETGGQVAKILQWLRESEELLLPNLQKDTIDDVLADREGYFKDLTPKAKRVLQLRQYLSRASTKKLYKFLECVCGDGRIRGLLQYHGAQTGRFAGRLVQPQNFPRGDKDILKSGIETIIDAIKCVDADLLTMLFGNAMETVATSLRGMFVSAPKKILRVADFAAIEARVVMWTANQEDALEAFRKYDRKEGPNIYCIMAEKLYKRPIDKHDDPKEYLLGKITVLGCFAPETLVLTGRGWIPILYVKDTDIVWDGEEWVATSGAKYQGVKSLIRMANIRVTSNHKILTPQGWKDAEEVADESKNFLQSGINLARSLLRGLKLDHGEASSTYMLNANVPMCSTQSISAIYEQEERLSARHVLGNHQRGREKNYMDTSMLFPTIYSGSVGVIDTQLSWDDATTKVFQVINTMAQEVFTFLKNGIHELDFLKISLHLMGGMKNFLNWIERTMTAHMLYGMSKCPLAVKIWETQGKLLKLFTKKRLCALLNLEENIVANYHKVQSLDGYEKEKRHNNVLTTNGKQEEVEVYDLIDCGPRNRFTILTDKGPLIVHNSAYGMSAEKLMFQAWKDYKVKLDLPTAEFLIQGYRSTYSNVKYLWYGTEEAAINAVQNPGKTCSYSKIAYQTVQDDAGYWLTCILPSGRRIWYLNPRLDEVLVTYKNGDKRLKNQLVYDGRDSKMGGHWSEVRTYGASLVENHTQAIARDLMVDSMLRVEAAGYELILTVHDEDVSETDPSHGSLKEFNNLMEIAPQWATGCPISAEPWEGTRYRKA